MDVRRSNLSRLPEQTVKPRNISYPQTALTSLAHRHLRGVERHEFLTHDGHRSRTDSLISIAADCAVPFVRRWNTLNLALKVGDFGVLTTLLVFWEGVCELPEAVWLLPLAKKPRMSPPCAFAGVFALFNDIFYTKYWGFTLFQEPTSRLGTRTRTERAKDRTER